MNGSVKIVHYLHYFVAMNRSDVYQQRPGTSNLGHEYECLIPALFAVRAICNADIEDLWLASNMESMGAFDDVVVHLKYKNGRRKVYVIQLKHKKDSIPPAAFTKTGGDYSISKYQTSFSMVTQNLSLLDVLGVEDVVFLIYTTANLSKAAPKTVLKDSNVVLSSQAANEEEFWLLNTNSSKDCVFCFQAQDNNKNVYNEAFLSRFFLYINQSKTNIVEQLIQQILQENFSSFNTNVLLNLLNYTKLWSRGELGGHYKLTINKIRLKVGELLLTPYLVEPKAIASFKRANVWTEFAKSAEILALANYNEEMLSKIWSAINDILHTYSDKKILEGISWENSLGLKVNELPKKFKKHGLQDITLEEVGEERELTMKILYVILWKAGLVPLVLSCNDPTEADVIFKALKLMKCDDTRRHAILLLKGDVVDWNDAAKTFKIAHSLADVNDTTLLNRILENLEISLQGRKPIKLSELVKCDSEILKTVTTTMVLQMLYQPLIVGQQYKRLPENYISRSIPKLFLTPSVLKQPNAAFVVYGSGDFANQLKQMTDSWRVIDGSNYFKHINVDDANSLQNIVTLEEGKKLSIEENAHLLRAGNSLHYLRFNNDRLEWFYSLGKTEEIRKHTYQLRASCNTVVSEDDILNYFCEAVCILSAYPGMGKTIMMNYLAATCMEDYWVVPIRLNDCYEYFEGCKYNKVFDVVKHFLEVEAKKSATDCQNIVRGFTSILTAKKKVLFLIDDFDEVSHQCAKGVVAFVKFLIEENHNQEEYKYRVWICTRPVKSSYLETKLNRFALTLMHVTIDDQKRYLKNRLFPQNKQNLDAFVTNLLALMSKSFTKWDLGFLGVPLHLHMITEVFAEYDINDLNKLEKLTTVELYEKFISKKIYEYWRRTFGDCRTASNRKRFEKELKVLKDRHAMAALLLFYPKDALLDILDNTDIQQFLKDTKEGDENIGIIISVNDSDMPIFAHQTFAEYLVATYLAKSYQNEKTKPLLKELFTEKLMVVRQLFDRLLAEHRPLHLAVLDHDLTGVVKYMENRKDDFDLDHGGRTPLHLAAAWGTNHAFPQLNTVSEVRRTRSIIVEDHKADSPDLKFQQITKILIRVSEFFAKIDHVFGWSPIDYAIKNRSLDILEIMYAFGKQISILDFFNNDSLVYYCVKYGYENILATIPIETCIFVDSYRRSLIQVAVDNQQNNSNVVELLLSKCDSWILKLWAMGDEKGNTAITEAALKGQVDILKILLRHYKMHLNKTNIYGLSPLHVSVFYGNPEFAKELLKQDSVDVNLRIKNHSLRDNTFKNPGHTALYLAANDNNLELVTLLLENGGEINWTYENGRTVLHAATIIGSMECVEELVRRGAELDAVDYEGRTPLHYVAQKGSVENVNQLLHMGADINKTDSFGCTFLHYAAQNLPLKKVVFSKGLKIDANQSDASGRTPLHYISRKVTVAKIKFLLRSATHMSNRRHYGTSSGHRATNVEKIDNINYLLELGADSNKGDAEGKTPLHYATEEGSLENMKCLLSLGADINKEDLEGRTSLYLGVQTGKLKIVKFLMQFAPKLNKGDTFKVTPLHLASERGYSGTVQELIKAGSNLNLGTVDGCTPLLLAIKNKNQATVKLLLTNNANPNKPSYDTFINGKANCISQKCNDGTASCTPLQLTVQAGKVEAVKSLLEWNVKVNQINKDGWASLHCAASLGHCEIVEELVKNGAGANLRTAEGFTPSHLAAKEGHCKALQMLLKASHKIDQTDNEMRTPLHFASFYGHISCVQILVEKGADVNSISSQGFTPLDAAVNQGHVEVELYLKQICSSSE